MGCGPSRPKRRPSPIGDPISIAPRRESIELVPLDGRSYGRRSASSAQPTPGQAAAASAEYMIDAQSMHQALHNTASYLHGRGAHLEIVAVGGAVNTLRLRTRQSTHDVDFFAFQEMSRNDARLLSQAAKYAEGQSSVRLGSKWLNSMTMPLIPKALLPLLAEQSRAQNDIMFREPGLTVYTASWKYAFAAKVNRMFYSHREPGARPYDAADAAAYLHEYIATHTDQPVPVSLIRQWGSQYGQQVPDPQLRTVDQEYRAKYRKAGIDFKR